jgi:penicillin amidase
MNPDENNSNNGSSPADRKPDDRKPAAPRGGGGGTDPGEDPRREATATATASSEPRRPGVGRRTKFAGAILVVLAVLAAAAFLYGRYYFHKAMADNLPRLDGSLTVYGLAAPVTVARDAQGVPHIRARSMEDLVFAQGFVTAQDRLWQMDMLRRHAAGELAAILGSNALQYDRLQRTLQLRVAADRAWAALPPEQKHWLEIYARGVNASMVAQSSHLPVEFRLLGYRPAPWTPRDSVLVELGMFQDLTTGFPSKLGREALAAHLPPDLIADLYPVGSWRDHPPGAPIPDLSAPQPVIKGIPLDESQSRLRRPVDGAASVEDLLALEQTLALFHPPCAACVAGSNAWAVSGARTASGKPLLSNDMHLNLSVPSLWYEADLAATLPAPLAAFHAAGVTLPGMPFVVAGHNDHVAWGFTNLGADVQDLYIEHTRGTTSGAQYQAANGSWRPVTYQTEIIHVRGSKDVVLDVPLTHHGNNDTPVISSIFAGETRSISLQWTIYDPANVTAPFFAVDSAGDGTSLLNAFSTWGGPPQNLIYADDQGHIGYHAVGRIPLRGDANNPSPLSPVPTDATAPDAAAHEWAGYIPFAQLPQAIDPPDGVLATANARVTLDGYAFPITLDWMAPYRTERIYKVLEASPPASAGAAESSAVMHKFTPEEMLALQNDVYSELDQLIAQRLAYSIDHTTGPLKNDAQLRQAADLLRKWNGVVDADAAAPAIVDSARAAFWPMLLIPKLVPQLASQLAQGVDLSKIKNLSADAVRTGDLWQVYTWGERDSVEEELITHTPAKWLPPGYATWEDFLAAVTQRGLRDAKAPRDLATWQKGKAFPLDIEHPVFSQSELVRLLVAVPTGTGPQAQSGDLTTVKQVGYAFGPSERFTTDLSNPDETTLNLVLGQSGDPISPWFMDQFQDWLHGRTYPMPFSPAATQAATTHTLTLTPR